ncbi:hypothetical protein HDK77DRAFT_273933 [Phyllosticta capitalensis]
MAPKRNGCRQSNNCRYVGALLTFDLFFLVHASHRVTADRPNNSHATQSLGIVPAAHRHLQPRQTRSSSSSSTAADADTRSDLEPFGIGRHEGWNSPKGPSARHLEKNRHVWFPICWRCDMRYAMRKTPKTSVTSDGHVTKTDGWHIACLLCLGGQSVGWSVSAQPAPRE